MKVLKVLSRLVSRAMGRIGAWLIPDHMKRIMFLVTLYHYMIDDPDNECLDGLEELNRQLLLAKTDASALELPGRLTRYIWKQELAERYMSSYDDERLSQWISRTTPCWLQYGRTSDILDDVKKLRSFVGAH